MVVGSSKNLNKISYNKIKPSYIVNTCSESKLLQLLVPLALLTRNLAKFAFYYLIEVAN